MCRRISECMGSCHVAECMSQVQASELHGLGAFARTRIAAGTILGGYPGRPRLPIDMRAKCEQAPRAVEYAMQIPEWRGGGYLDPTDASGDPSGYPQPGLPWPVDINIILTRVNEPPPGRTTNVRIEDGRSAADMLFVTTSEVMEGEELFIDYGTDYNRSGYNIAPKFGN